MKLLRQNTATIVNFGPILGTDFLTVQTGISLTSGRAELFVAGSTAAIDLSTRTWAHITGGVYQLSLLGSDLSTPGPLMIHIHAASTQPLMLEGNVLVPAAYDALCAGGAMPANVQQINGSLAAAANHSAAALGLTTLTIGNSSSTTLLSTNLTVATSGFYTGRTLIFTSGLLAGQAATITAYNGATKQLSVAQLTGAPSVGDSAVIV